MLKNFRLIAAQSSPVSPLGQLDYREGWFAIIPKEGKPGETLCGIQVLFFSCVCLMASMARSVNCHGQKNAVQVHLIGAEPIVQVKR